MYGFDRDGTIIGSLTSYEANHPQNIKSVQDMVLIQPVVDWINTNGGIVLSNQDGPSKFKHWVNIAHEFKYLMDIVPGLQACFWSMAHRGVEGAVCHHLTRDGQGKLVHGQTKMEGSTTFRKPDEGMAVLAKKMGYSLTHYMGDLSGNPDYANGKDSDLFFALNSRLKYIDVRDFIKGV